MPTSTSSISGQNLCTIRLVATRQNEKEDYPQKPTIEPYAWEEEALGQLRQHRREIEREIEGWVVRTMPRGIVLESLEFRRGSVEIVISLATVVAAYAIIAQYHDFVESVNMFVSQMRRFFRRVLRSDVHLDAFVVFESRWSSSPSTPAFGASSPGSSLAVVYLVLTNAFLIGLLAYLLLVR